MFCFLRKKKSKKKQTMDFFCCAKLHETEVYSTDDIRFCFCISSLPLFVCVCVYLCYLSVLCDLFVKSILYVWFLLCGLWTTHKYKIKWNFSKFICLCCLSSLTHSTVSIAVLYFFFSHFDSLISFRFTRNFIPLRFNERKAPFILNEIIVICSRFNGEEINSILLNSNEFGIHLPVLFHHNFSHAQLTNAHTRAHSNKYKTKYFHLIFRLYFIVSS